MGIVMLKQLAVDRFTILIAMVVLATFYPSRVQIIHYFNILTTVLYGAVLLHGAKLSLKPWLKGCCIGKCFGVAFTFVIFPALVLAKPVLELLGQQLWGFLYVLFAINSTILYCIYFDG